jgi:hypothetical protein
MYFTIGSVTVKREGTKGRRKEREKGVKEDEAVLI